MHTRLLSLVLLLALLLAATLASADPITVAPTDLNPGDPYRLAFVTSTTRDATSSNIAEYNAFVTAAAEAVSDLLALGTTWTAIGSTVAVDARDNTNTNPGSGAGVPIYLLNDTLLAADNDDLWNGPLPTRFEIDEHGNVWSGLVWTGTRPDGTSVAPSQLGATDPYQGAASITSGGWVTYQPSAAPGQALPFYAISDTLILIPEPGTVALVTLGLAVLGHRVRRQRG